MNTKILLPDRALYVRNIIFGVEDSLISTLGFLAGITVAGLRAQDILTTGLILILVEAFSMGVGSFLSEESVEEYEHHVSASLKNSLVAGLTMFFSYLFSGFIPLGPYIFLSPTAAFWPSIFLSLIALFFLGVFRGKMSRVNPVRTGIRMLVIGGCAMMIGICVGFFFAQR